MLKLHATSQDFRAAREGRSLVVISTEALDEGQDIELISPSLDQQAWFDLMDEDFIADETRMRKLFAIITKLPSDQFDAAFEYRHVAGDPSYAEIKINLAFNEFEEIGGNTELAFDENTGSSQVMRLAAAGKWTYLTENNVKGDSTEWLYDQDIWGDSEIVANLIEAFPELEMKIDGVPFNALSGQACINNARRFDGKTFFDGNGSLVGHTEDNLIKIFQYPAFSSSIKSYPYIFVTALILGTQEMHNCPPIAYVDLPTGVRNGTPTLFTTCKI